MSGWAGTRLHNALPPPPPWVFVDHFNCPYVGKLCWCLTKTNTTVTQRPRNIDNTPAAACSNFGGVKFALSHCVQQCLAQAPLLAVVAVALSFLYSKFTAGQFQEQVSASWVKTKEQRRLSAAVDKLNKSYGFAVLQLTANPEPWDAPYSAFSIWNVSVSSLCLYRRGTVV